MNEYDDLVQSAREYEEESKAAPREQQRELKRLARECWRKALRLKYKFGEPDQY